MYRKKFSKASQEWLWTRCTSKWLIFRLFLLVPYTAYPSKSSRDSQNWGWFNPRSQVINEEYLVMVGAVPVTFLGRLLFLHEDAVIDWLIKCVQLAAAVDHSPALNRPCLPAWTQLTYFLFFSTSSVFPLHLAMSRIFYFAPVSKTPRGVSIISEWPSDMGASTVAPGFSRKNQQAPSAQLVDYTAWFMCSSPTVLCAYDGRKNNVIFIQRMLTTWQAAKHTFPNLASAFAYTRRPLLTPRASSFSVLFLTTVVHTRKQRKLLLLSRVAGAHRGEARTFRPDRGYCVVRGGGIGPFSRAIMLSITRHFIITFTHQHPPSLL